MKRCLILFIPIILTACAGNSIFAPAPTTTDPALVVMPNPIAVKAVSATGKVFLLNSNGRTQYGTGSFAQLSFDATTTTSPTVSADKIVDIDSFSGGMALDAQFAYITNRLSSINTEESSARDHVIKLEIDDGSLAETARATVGPNPFGIAISGTDLFVASDNEIDRLLTTDLSSAATLLLTELTSTASNHIQGVAVDSTNNWLFVTNRTDSILILDTTDNSLDYIVQGPTNTRGIAFSGGRMYVIDGASLYVLTTSALAKQTSTATIDDSGLLLAQIPIGLDPCEIAVDDTNNRAYVTNTGSDDVSVIDTQSFDEIARISVHSASTPATTTYANQPCGVDVATFNSVPYVFIANYESDNLSVINAQTLKVVATFPR